MEAAERFMSFTEDILVEDWQGLESETERLLMIYGYPSISVTQSGADIEETEATGNTSL
jgi:hypothetical protein